MYSTRKIDKKFPGVVELLAKTFPSYKGRKFYLDTQKTIDFSDINWEGGSRTEYFLVNTDNLTVQKVNNSQAPWTKYAHDAAQIRDIPKNAIIVSQSCFCGKMGGIRFVVSSNLFPNALEDSTEGLEASLQTGNIVKLTNTLS